MHIRRAVLFADRFWCRDGETFDLATGHRVSLEVAAAGTQRDRRVWLDACVRAHAEGRLFDFGFVGTTRRFEAAALPGMPQFDAKQRNDVIDWLEHPHPWSARLLRVGVLPDPRSIRVCGFIPCAVSLFRNARFAVDVPSLFAGRSVVLVDAAGDGAQVAFALLQLRRHGVREMFVLSRRTRESERQVLVAQAAEGRVAYGVAGPSVDPRAIRMMSDSVRLLARGRHAAAERGLRSAAAAFDRRHDLVRAGEASVALGRLLLARGRASAAKDAFEIAADRFHRAQAAVPAVEAALAIGLAQTDLARLGDAEQTCRTAYSAASSLGSAPLRLASVVCLARALLWQRRFGDARSLLESVDSSGASEDSARYWCLVARLRIVDNRVPDAWAAVQHARAVSDGSAAIESLVRVWEAVVQTCLGDLDAVDVHVRRGVAAARAAHLPVRTLKLRLVWVDALIRAGRTAQARAAVRHLRTMRRSSIPPLLHSRIDEMFQKIDAPDAGSQTARPTAVRESVASFHAAPRINGVEDLEGLRDLLALAHQADEADALARAAASMRTHLHAVGIAIVAATAIGPRKLAGSGKHTEAVARRAIDIAQPIRPAPGGGGTEAAVPIHYLGRCVGAIAVTWNIEGPEHADRSLAFAAAAAAVCAPLVYVFVERDNVPAVGDAAVDILGVSPAMDQVRKAIARASNAPFTVLVEGESGSGKELVARAVHRSGCRRDRRFCALNCAAMPEDLVDAELFGHAKGAFTGATLERTGLFESADGGSVFLDEVSELSARAQAKVLRVLQEGEVRRIGENFTRPFDARLIAATNRPLRTEVEAGRFRMDLLYRLDVIRISVPPLRERVEDIPLLAARFWRESAARIASKAVLGQSALSALARYDWPGNVRELQNVLAALAVSAPHRGVVGASELPAAIGRAWQPGTHESLESARLAFEQRFVRAALARAAGHRGRTAQALGLSRQGLAKLMQRLQLDA